MRDEDGRPATDPGELQPPAPSRPRAGRDWKQLAVRLIGLAIVVVTFVFVLPRVANYGEVWSIVEALTAWEIALLVVVTLVNLATFAPPWMAAMPGLGFVHAMVLTQSTTAASSILPGGDAVGLALAYRMLRKWGFAAADVARGLVVTAMLNVLANVALPVIAIALLAVTQGVSHFLELAGIIGAVALVVTLVLLIWALRGERQAHALGHLAGRVVSWPLGLVGRGPLRNWGPALVEFRDQSIDLLRRRWLALGGAALVGHLTVFFVLLACLRVLEVPASDVNFWEAFAAWGLIRLITTVPITPGGFGVVELGLTGLLVGFGGAQAPVVAAVLMYRVLTVVPPLVIGGVCILVWDRMNPTVSGAEEPEGARAGPVA
jgi:uncharacterized protein (TIRG00374 family)